MTILWSKAKVRDVKNISNFDIQSLTLGENEPLAVTNRGTMASPAHSISFSGSTPDDTVRLLKDEPTLKLCGVFQMSCCPALNQSWLAWQCVMANQINIVYTTSA